MRYLSFHDCGHEDFCLLVFDTVYSGTLLPSHRLFYLENGHTTFLRHSVALYQTVWPHDVINFGNHIFFHLTADTSFCLLSIGLQIYYFLAFHFLFSLSAFFLPRHSVFFIIPVNLQGLIYLSTDSCIHQFQYSELFPKLNTWKFLQKM